MPCTKVTKFTLLFVTAAGILFVGTKRIAQAMPPVESATPQANTDHSAGGAGQAQPSLDFDVYRSRVEPIFLKKREGGMRCYDCHSVMVTRLRLEPLSPGSSSWTEEQSRKNFEAVSQFV